jgi:hypothetical protein
MTSLADIGPWSCRTKVSLSKVIVLPSHEVVGPNVAMTIVPP